MNSPEIFCLVHLLESVCSVLKAALGDEEKGTYNSQFSVKKNKKTRTQT